ncbi:hypothetical protein Tco_0739800 [Tanacetum coccineum]
MSSLASFLLWLEVSADLLVLLLLSACPYRDAPDLSHECMSLFLSTNRLKIFLSLGPSLVNTVALTELLRRVGLSFSCLSLENTLAVCEGRVPLDAVTGLCLLFLGLFFLSHDSDSENCGYFPKFIRRETPRIAIGCLLTPLAGYVSDCGVGEYMGWTLLLPGGCHYRTSGSRGEVHLITQWVNEAVVVRSTSMMLPPFVA